MGAKFANLQVQTDDCAAVEALCPDCTVRQIFPGWVTVVHEDFCWGYAQEPAKMLSKSLGLPVVATEYFDDDYLELTVFCQGKRVARHVPAGYEDSAPKKGKPEEFIAALGLSPETKGTLAVIFKESNVDLALNLIAAMLNCPLSAQAECLEGAFLQPDKDRLEEYLVRKKAERTLKNQTKLVLVEEQECNLRSDTYPVMCLEQESEEGFSVYSFWDVEEGGGLRKLLREKMPGPAENYLPNAYADGRFLVTCAAYDPAERDWMERSPHYYLYGFYGGEDGPGVADIEKEIGPLGGAVSFLDESRIFMNGVCYDLQTEQRVWTLDGLEQTNFSPLCPLGNGAFVATHDSGTDGNRQALTVFQADGTILATRELEQYCQRPMVWENEIYICCQEDGETVWLLCFGPDLAERWRLDVSGEGSSFFPGDPPMLVDEVKRTLYLCPERHHLLAVDLAQRQVCARRQFSDDAFFRLEAVLPGVGPVLESDFRYVEVLSGNLTTISRHRTKGGVLHYLPQKQGVRILTFEHGSYAVPGSLRLYELHGKP